MSWFSDFKEYRKQKALSRITFPGGQYGSTGDGALAEAVIAMLTGVQPTNKINFAQEVGDLRLSSLAMSGVNWVSRNLTTARMRVITLDADNKETEVKDHPLPALWKNPNPWYSGKQLLSGIGLSNVIDGGAYLLKLRNRMGQINQLWYEPHWTIRPRWPQDGSQFIAYYEIKRQGVWNRIETEDVFFSADRIDPETRRGMNGTSAMMREYYTDQQAAKFSAMLLRNGLVPPIVVTVGNKEHAMPKDIFQVFRKEAEARLSGENAAKPFFINGPASVEKLGFEYDKVGMSEIRNPPKERFCSVMGISPHSLHFMSDSETYDNVRQYLRYDYISYIVQLHTRLAEDITRDDQSEMGAHLLQPGEVLDWDYSAVELMQLDTSAEWERIEGAFKSRIIDQAEARDGIGYKFDETHKGVYYPVPSNNLTISPLEELPEPRVPVTLNPAQPPLQIEENTNGNGKHVHLKAPGDEGAGALDALVAGAVSRLKKALTLLPESVDWRGLLANIEEAYALRDIEGVMAAIPFEFIDAEMEELIHDAVLEAVETTGTKALMDLPRTGLVPRFDMKNPQVINWAERHAAEQVTGIGTETRAAIRGLISRSVSEGIDAKSIARMIREQIGLNERQAETIAALRDKLIKDGLAPARIEKLLEAATKRAIRQRAETIARTECLPADALVDAAMVRAASRRWYDGTMFEIITSRGRKLSATPNHPMLTRRGWVGAGFLQLDDYLICDSRDQDSRSTGSEYIHRGPTPIGEIFDALSAISVRERKRTGQPDFHGDGMDGYVDILRPYGPLIVGQFSPLDKPLAYSVLSPAEFADASICGTCGCRVTVNQPMCLCTGSGLYAALAQAAGDDATGDAIASSQLACRDAAKILSAYMIRRNIVPYVMDIPAVGKEQSPSLGSGTGYPSVANDFASPRFVGSQPGSDGFNGQPAQIEIDGIRSIRQRSFSGHVYNLTTTHGYYTTNHGLYTGNCLTAANKGLQEGWRQAAHSGLLDPTKTQRVWILSGNACPLCHSIKDANPAIPLEGNWVGGDGIETPPAHP